MSKPDKPREGTWYMVKMLGLDAMYYKFEEELTTLWIQDKLPDKICGFYGCKVRGIEDENGRVVEQRVTFMRETWVTVEDTWLKTEHIHSITMADTAMQRALDESTSIKWGFRKPIVIPTMGQVASVAESKGEKKLIVEG